MKEPDPEHVLQHLDLVADGTSRHVQLIGRLCEAQVAGSDIEGAQSFERELGIHGTVRRALGPTPRRHLHALRRRQLAAVGGYPIGGH